MADDGFDILKMMNVVVPERPTPRVTRADYNNYNPSLSRDQPSYRVFRPALRAGERATPQTTPVSRTQQKKVSEPTTPATTPAHETDYTTNPNREAAAPGSTETPSRKWKDPAFMTSTEMAMMSPAQKREYLDYLKTRKPQEVKEEEVIDPAKPYVWCDDCLQALLDKRKAELLAKQKDMDQKELHRLLEEEKKALEAEIQKQKEAREKAAKELKEAEEQRRKILEERKAQAQKENQAERDRLKALAAASRDKALADEAKRREEIQKAMRECLDAKRARLMREKEEEALRDAASGALPITGLVATPEQIAANRERIRKELQDQIDQGRIGAMTARERQLEEDRRLNALNKAQLEAAQARARELAAQRAKDLTSSWTDSIEQKRSAEKAQRDADIAAYADSLRKNKELAEAEARALAEQREKQKAALGHDLAEAEENAALDRALMNFIEKEAGNRLFNAVAKRHGPNCNCAICSRCGRVVPKTRLNVLTPQRAEELLQEAGSV